MRRLLFCLLLALPVPASARSEGRTLSYQREHVWPTAVRFLVVDEKAKVLDKDSDAGYVLFEIKDDNKTYRGSLEIMTVLVDGQANIKFSINIIDRPLWKEAGMVERLEKKLRNELGSPPPPKKKDPPKEEKKEEPPKDSKDKTLPEARSTTP
jgi:hypothetical protein